MKPLHYILFVILGVGSISLLMAGHSLAGGLLILFAIVYCIWRLLNDNDGGGWYELT